MSDPFSFNMIHAKSILLRNLAMYIEKSCLKSYNLIIVLNEKVVDKYIELYPYVASSIVCIEQGVDQEFIEQIESDSVASNDVFTFLYAGAFYKNGRVPYHMFTAFMQTRKNIVLHTYSTNKRGLRPATSERIQHFSRIPKSSLVKVTASADALVLLDNDHGCQVPGKTLELLSINKPLLFIYSNENSPTLDYVKSAKGVVFAKNNVTSISDGIAMILDNRHEPRGFDYNAYTWEEMRMKLSQFCAMRGIDGFYNKS